MCALLTLISHLIDGEKAFCNGAPSAVEGLAISGVVAAAMLWENLELFAKSYSPLPPRSTGWVSHAFKDSLRCCGNISIF